MNTYQQEIVAFFSTEENYTNMHKIVQHYGLVRNSLLQEFWKLVEDKLKLIINEELNKQWQIKQVEKIEVAHSKLMLFKNSWTNSDGNPITAIAYERLGSNDYPFYGLFINLHESQNYNMDFIRLEARKFLDNVLTDSNKWWSFYYHSGLNFSKVEDFVAILPANRDFTADSFANTLYNLANSIESKVDELLISAKKQ